MNTVTVILASFVLVIFLANVFVTYRVMKSEYYESKQKYMQYALIWLLPAAGTLFCYVLAREPSASHSGTYPRDNSLYDDGNVGIENSTVDFFGGGHHGN